MNVVINNVSVGFDVSGNDVFTSSTHIAEVFEKRHREVLRTIKALPKDNFTERNFALSKYMDITGRTLPMYQITRDGFSLLVMGFTGEQAYRWKIAFIEAFNMMEAELRRGSQSESVQTLIERAKSLPIKSYKDLREASAFVAFVAKVGGHAGKQAALEILGLETCELDATSDIDSWVRENIIYSTGAMGILQEFHRAYVADGGEREANSLAIAIRRVTGVRSSLKKLDGKTTRIYQGLALKREMKEREEEFFLSCSEFPNS